MTQVYTDLGPGRIVESKTVHGRTEHRVEGGHFDKWFDATRLGFAEVNEDNSVDLPYNPEPQYGVGPLTDATIQPIHEIDPDKRLAPADSLTFDSVGEDESGLRGEPGPNPELFARSAGWQQTPERGREQSFGAGGGHPYGLEPDYSAAHEDWAESNPGEHPEDSPYFHSLHPQVQQQLMDQHEGGDTYAGDPMEDIAQGRMYQQHMQNPTNMMHGYRTADALEGAPSHMTPEFVVNDTDDEFLRHNVDLEEDERETVGPDGIVHFTGARYAVEQAAFGGASGSSASQSPDAAATAAGNGPGTFDSPQNASSDDLGGITGGLGHRTARQHLALPAVIPFAAEALGAGGGAGAAAGAGEAGAAGGAGMGLPGAAGKALQMGQGANAVNNAVQRFDDNGNPLPLPDLGQGWGDLVQKKGYTDHEAVDWSGMYHQFADHPIDSEGGYQVMSPHEWMASHPEGEDERRPAFASYRPAGLSDRYADISINTDPNDHVAQFRHDPAAFINRMGHVHDEGLNPRMASYVDLVDADEQIRTAAWKDVREKAMRLRREGRVHVKDVDTDRIYASVDGDNGTYDVMIKKGGDFGGFGGGHSVTNWHCSCEWGKWAFRRQFTFVGRLCSHGYASYMEMQSKHLTGQPVRRKTRYPKRASVRTAEDQTEQDWKVEDTGGAAGALDEIRNWAETPEENDFGHMDQRREDIRDAVERARDEGVDADQLVASLHRQAAPPDPNALFGGGGGMGGAPAADSGSMFGTGGGMGGTPPPMIGPAGGGMKDPGAVSQSQGVSNTNAGGLFGPSTSGGGGNPEPSMFGGGGGMGGSPSPAAPGAIGDAAAGVNGGTGAGGAGGSYTVKPGDTEAGIAKSEGIANAGDIAKANPGAMSSGTDLSKNQDMIHPGDVLKMPGAGGSGGGSSTYTSPDGMGGGAGGPGASKVDTSAVPGSTGGGSGGSSGTSSVFGGGGGMGAAPKSDSSSSLNIGGGGSGSTDNTAPPLIGDSASGSTSKNSMRRRGDAMATGDAGGQGSNGGAMGGGGSALSAVPGSTDSSNQMGTSAAGADFSQVGSGTTPGMGTGGMAAGMGAAADQANSGIGDIASDPMGLGSSGLGSVLSYRELTADRDWLLAAFPDSAPGAFGHKPFNGSGGENITEWEQSKDNVKENYSDARQDIVDEPKKSYMTDMGTVEQMRDSDKDHTAHVGMVGISRAGRGPQRAPVIPEVVRERKPRRPGAVEAAVLPDDDFDPLAPRTAASFDDPYAANGENVVAAFQRQADAGGSAISAAPSSQYDDFTSSPVFQQVAGRMQRTAGRNYSLAEQAALMREGDRGGASNLDQLDLKDTHYEAMNSVGLW